MVIRALPGSAGYMFASWPAAPPVFEGVSRAARLFVPLPARASIEAPGPVAIGAPLAPPVEGQPAALAPVAGRVVGPAGRRSRCASAS